MNRIFDETGSSHATSRPTLQAAFACVMGYLLLAGLGQSLDNLQGISSPFWPAAGLALVACYRFGAYGALCVYGAVLFGQFVLGRPVAGWVTWVSPLGPATAAMLSAWLLRRLRFDVMALSMREVVLLCGVAAPVSASLSVVLGLAPFFVDGADVASTTLSAIRHWWLGDYVGILVAAPLAFTVGRFLRVLRDGELRQFVWMHLGLLGVLVVTFPMNSSGVPMSWYTAAPVVWIAARFGVLGAGVSVGIVAVASLLSTSHGLGPFAFARMGENGYLYLQQFLCVTAVSSHIVAVLSDERRGARELERTRSAVREREQRLQLALEAGQMGVWTLDPKAAGGPQLLLDAYLTELLQLPHDADPHQAWQAALGVLIRPEDQLKAEQALRKAYLEGESVAYDFQVRRPSGELRWMSAHVRRVLEQAGEKPLLVGVIMDVSHLKRSEQALAHSHDMLAAALSASRTGLWQWVAAEDTLEYSPECRQLLGLPDSEQSLRSRHSLRQVHPDDLDRVVRSRKQALQSRTPWVSEFRMLRWGTEQQFWVEVRASGRYDEKGRLTRMLGSITDVTERKGSETALRAATHGLVKAKKAAEELANRLELRVRERTEELDRALSAARAASQAKSDFLAHMSHEVRTPLTGMIAAADLLMHELPDGAHRARAQMLRASALALKGLLDDVLDFARIEAGKLGLVETRFDPQAMLSGVVELFSEVARTRGNRIELRTQGLPAACLADGARLRQVLVNLVGNAVKFTEHGHIRIDATYLGEERLRLVVRDTGIGLTDELKQRLFKPFEQADALQFGGTGLGLAISQRLVTAMGGRILADGTPGQGAQFTVEVPCQRTEPAPVSCEPEPKLPSLRLLLAEDNAMNRTLIVSLLEQAGHQVDAVADGLQALESAQKRVYDLVLMDVRMPRMDGREATRRIRLHEQGFDRVPVVALSADALELSRLKDDADFDALVAKPVDLEELSRVMHQVLGMAAGRRRMLSELQSARGPGKDGAFARAASLPPLLDESRLRSLSDKLGAERLTPVLEGAPAALQDVFERLCAALEHGAVAEQQDCAHELKGLAASLGCVRLAQLAEQQQHQPDTHAVEALEQCLALTRQALEQHSRESMLS